MEVSRKKILGAFLVGSVFVILALVVRANQTTTDTTNDGELSVATAAMPRNHIEVSDKDDDGIPDWQEALQKTEPVVLDEISETYEPETVTEQFSIDFLQNMVLSSNYGEFGSSPEEMAKLATNEMSEMAKDELYTEEDIVINPDNEKTAVKNYANQMATIVLDNTMPADSLNEIEVLKQAYATENEDRLDDLDPIISMYENMLTRSLAVPVPSEYQEEHLNILNVYNAMYKDIEAMKYAFTDPIKTMVRLKRYEEDLTSLYIVLLNLNKKMLEDGVTITENDPAYTFFVKP